ncbi:MAG: PIN domain-containing protein [Candidatus Methanomethylicia archaeon]
MQRRNLAVVDTNVMVYDLISNSPYHDDARRKLNSLERIVILPNILIEFILVLLRLNVDENIIKDKVIEIIENSVFVRVKKIDVIRALELSVKEVNDAILVVVAKRLELPVISYDSDVIEMCKRLGVKVI